MVNWERGAIMKLSDYIDNLRNKRIVVIGIGISNRPLLRLLLEHGCRVTACDRAERVALGETVEELESLGAVLKLGPDYLKGLDADVIFRTPGMHPDTPELVAARERGCRITSEMEAFFQVCPCKIIAVTGSDGKTTTTSIIAELLRSGGYTVHVGGNIGTPLLSQADQMDEKDVAVLELSSFQLMTMDQSPAVAVVTNVAPNHLDVHKDMDEYVNAKRQIFAHQRCTDTVVLNLDNTITRAFAKSAPGYVRMFSRTQEVPNGCFLKDGVIYMAEDGNAVPVMDAADIFLPGVHNIENFMAAFAAVRGLVGIDILKETAMTFKGVEHRIEFVRELDGVKYYNDSIASSPTRTIAGLRSFAQKVILIAGGKDKGVPFDTLGPEIIDHVKLLVLTGLTAGKIRAAVEETAGYDGKPEILEIDGFKEAVVTAAKAARPGDIVILSPACTSFDRFKNFAERGRVFKEIVNGLESNK
jgi:UDP-N-acetylmuramoylalanine--D-glutamate ligase